MPFFRGCPLCLVKVIPCPMVIKTPNHIVQKTVSEQFALLDIDDPQINILFDLSLKKLDRAVEENRALGFILEARLEGNEKKDAPASGLPTEKDILKTELKVPAISKVVFDLESAMKNNSASAVDLAEIVTRDPGLAALILKLVNSPFYSLCGKVDTLSRAIAVIGTRQLCMLAVGASIMDSLAKENIPGLDMRAYWRHSVACGTIARRLAGIHFPGMTETCFVGGLIHDLGLVAICKMNKDLGGLLLDRAREEKTPLCQVEEDVLGYTHAKAGGLLMKKWNFPLTLVAAVLYHHTPAATTKHPVPLVVYAANFIASAGGYPIEYGIRLEPPSAFVLQKILPNPDKLLKLLKESEQEIKTISQMIFDGTA